MVQLLGFQITRQTNDKEKPAEAKQAFTVPSPDDGTTTISAGGYFGQYLDMEVTAKNDVDLIKRYREIAQHPECDMAVEDIINEAIVSDDRDQSVSVSLDKLAISENIKGKIRNEFDEVMKLLNFDEKGHDIFRRWYVDGRIYFHKVIDPNSPRKGLTELRYIDPRKIKKVREVTKKRDTKGKGIEVIEKTAEWFVYNEKGMSSGNSNAGVKISTDSISYVTSGVIDQTKNMVMGHLHKAIKPVNQLRMIEDAVVIYRIVRAPERRIFYVDVGNLPKVKAESYLRDVMARYRNKLVYDASTGEIRDDRKHMSMLEDFWLPRREGAKGTEVSTLAGGQNLGEISDVQYFQKKLYKSLNVPISRMESENGFNLGRAAEITRDELKFTKFVQRLRKRFASLFNDILKSQLVLKGIITIEDWSKIKEHIQYDFLKDGYFAELKNAEMLRERITLAEQITPYIGKYFSVEYIRKYVLRQSDDDIIEIDNQIAKEIKQGIIASQGETMDIESGDSDINIGDN
ncbi:capsid assembly protein [uncultured Mediterranean phage]|nr:capsid assembly protein [uncultured Mediterranean phage]